MNYDPTKIDIQFDPRKQRMVGVARHGNTPFDVPFISEIAPGFWQGGCQDGLILPSVVEHVTSLYPWEKYTDNHGVISFLKFRMYDSLDQSFEQVDQIARWVNECRKSGVTLVHCQAGLNRSSLIAARALILDGLRPEDAIQLLRINRSPACLCNKAFEDWLLGSERREFEDETEFNV